MLVSEGLSGEASRALRTKGCDVTAAVGLAVGAELAVAEREEEWKRLEAAAR
jgi:hypothetical protein